MKNHYFNAVSLFIYLMLISMSVSLSTSLPLNQSDTVLYPELSSISDPLLPSVNMGQNGSTTYSATITQNASCMKENITIDTNQYSFPASEWTWTNSTYYIQNITHQGSFSWQTTEEMTPSYYFGMRNPAGSEIKSVPQELSQAIQFPFDINISYIRFQFRIRTLVTFNNALFNETLQNSFLEIRTDIGNQPHKTESIFQESLYSIKITNTSLYDIIISPQIILSKNVQYWIVLNFSTTIGDTNNQLQIPYFYNPDLLPAMNRSRTSIQANGNAGIVNELCSTSIADTNWEAKADYHPYLKVEYDIAQPLTPTDVGMNATINTYTNNVSSNEILHTGQVAFDHPNGVSQITFNTNISITFNLSIQLWGTKTISNVNALLNYSINSTHTLWNIQAQLSSWSYATFQSLSQNISFLINDPDLIITSFSTPLLNLDNNTHIIHCIGISTNILQSASHPTRIQRGITQNLWFNISHDSTYNILDSNILQVDLWSANGTWITSYGYAKFNDLNYINRYTVGIVNQDLLPLGDYWITITTRSTTPNLYWNTSQAFGIYSFELYDYAKSTVSFVDSNDRVLSGMNVTFTNLRLNHTQTLQTDEFGKVNASSLYVDSYNATWQQYDAQNKTINITQTINISYQGTNAIKSSSKNYYSVDIIIIVRDILERPFQAVVQVNNLPYPTAENGELRLRLLEGTYPLEVLVNNSVIYNSNITITQGINTTFICNTEINAFPEQIRWQMPIWAWIVIGVAGVTILGGYMWYAKIHPKKELATREEQMEKVKTMQFLQDILNLSAILVIEKVSKQTVYTQKYQMDLNEDLVSGFLGAINDWEGEVEHDSNKRGGLNTIQYHSFTVYFTHGDHGILITFMKKPIQSQKFQNLLQSALREIENKHQQDLANFNGFIAPFQQSVPQILTQYIPSKFQHKFMINKEAIEVVKFPVKIQDWWKQNYQGNEDFTLSQLIAYFRSANICDTLEDAYTQVYKLVVKNVLIEYYGWLI